MKRLFLACLGVAALAGAAAAADLGVRPAPYYKGRRRHTFRPIPGADSISA